LRRLLISGVFIAGLTAPTVVLLAPAAHANAGITCNKIKGSASSSVSVSSCKPETKATKPSFKTLTASSAVTLATGGTLQWNGGATVTLGQPTFTVYGGNGNPPIPQGACPKKGSQNEYVATAPVVAGDGTVAMTGDTFGPAYICTDKKGHFYLSPGTKIPI